jgi:hypothetical protein
MILVLIIWHLQQYNLSTYTEILAQLHSTNDNEEQHTQPLYSHDLSHKGVTEWQQQAAGGWAMCPNTCWKHLDVNLSILLGWQCIIGWQVSDVLKQQGGVIFKGQLKMRTQYFQICITEFKLQKLGTVSSKQNPRLKNCFLLHSNYLQCKGIKFNIPGSVHHKNILIYIQQDAMLHSLSGNCPTCFGWYPKHAIAICRYCGR